MLAGFDASLVERLTKEAALAMRVFALTGKHLMMLIIVNC